MGCIVESSQGRSVTRHDRGQAGASLIEILIVIAVAVPVILSAALGLLLTMRLSVSTEQTQKAEAQATAFAESVKEIDYTPCAGINTYKTAAGLWSPPAASRTTFEFVSVAHWSQSAKAYTNTSCATAADDEGAQLITIRAKTGERTSTLEVVKRNPDAAADPGTP
ncbi:MAG: hypothetical protein V9F03_04715 [Microthrixaceae bacterium]